MFKTLAAARAIALVLAALIIAAAAVVGARAIVVQQQIIEQQRAHIAEMQSELNDLDDVLANKQARLDQLGG